MHCCDTTTSSFVAKVQGRVFAHFRAFAIKHHSYMWNWLFSLPGWILYEHSTWCQRKWWSCSWLFFFTFLFSVSFDFPCMANAFFPKCFPNHCQGLRHTFYPRFLQNSMLFLCWIRCEITSGHVQR
jgi:hypothetical protein